MGSLLQDLTMATALVSLKLFLLLVLSVTSSWSCQTEDDCSLLGECTNGKCICDPGWKGEKCGQVDLLPASRYGGYRNESMSSWGGYSIKIREEWHMFASGMSHNCPLHDFMANSMTIHATSKTPGGPYKLEDISLPEFHHSVSVMQVNKTTLALVTEGITTNGSSIRHCESNSSIPSVDSYTDLGPDDDTDLGPDDYMGISISNSGPHGPWKEHFIWKANLSNREEWNCNVSNPSPIVFPNGTVLLMYRAVPCIPQHDRVPKCVNETADLCQHQGIAIADSIDGEFRDRNGFMPELSGNEDAVFFRTRRGFAAMFHSKNACGHGPEGGKICGSLAHSKDTWNWTLNNEPCYNGTVLWKEHNGDVTVDKFLSRQRPKIIFSEDGITPLYLTNGVLASEVGGGGMEFTLAMPFNVPENIYDENC